MKITRIKTLVCDAYRTNFIFVRVDTDEGLHGVGEATMSFGENAVVGCIKDLEPDILGRDPLAIDRLWHDAYRDSYWRGGPVLMSALAGLEMACWDLKGKALGQPLWQLLGGKFRDRVPCYANAWFVPARTPAEFATKAKEAVANGWQALKWDPFGSAYRDLTTAGLRHALACVAAVREAVGPDVDLMVEGHGRFDLQSALRVAHGLAEYDILWFEEPVFPENVEALAELRRRSPVPLAAGERIYTRHDARRFLEQGCAHFMQPDISRVGVHEIVHMSAWAETYGVAFCPHNPAGPVTNAATLHVAAAVPNFFLMETMSTDVPWRQDITTESLQLEGGAMVVPDGPGLGIDLCEEAIAAHPQKSYHLRHYRGDLTSIRPANAKAWFAASPAARSGEER